MPPESDRRAVVRKAQDGYRARLRAAGLCIDGCGAPAAVAGLCAEHYTIKRRRENGNGSRVYRCSVCREEGHNHRRCPKKGTPEGAA